MATEGEDTVKQLEPIEEEPDNVLKPAQEVEKEEIPERSASQESPESNKDSGLDSDNQSNKNFNRELKSLLELSKEAKLDTNIAHKRKSLDRHRNNDSQDGRDTPKKADAKKMKRERPSDKINVLENNKDAFCWRCHKPDIVVSCETCPRSYHVKCMKVVPSEHWQCPECLSILKAESTKTRSLSMKGLTLEELCKLLKFAHKRMKQVPDSEPFLHPVSEREFPDYKQFIVQPMDLTKLMKNIQANVYGSPNAFEADASWILHNSIIFNSYQSKLTSVAKQILKICRQEMSEIENCSNCYLNANTKENWFVQVCPKPHILLWAKLKGFPYWPAKVMSTNSGGMVDVRFFGAHDKAWVSHKDCYLYSQKNPNSHQLKRNDINECIKEVNVYINNLKKKYGTFKFAPVKLPFVLENDYLPQFLPKYKEINNLFKNESPKSDSGKTSTSDNKTPASSIKSQSDIEVEDDDDDDDSDDDDDDEDEDSATRNIHITGDIEDDTINDVAVNKEEPKISPKNEKFKTKEKIIEKVDTKGLNNELKVQNEEKLSKEEGERKESLTELKNNSNSMENISDTREKHPETMINSSVEMEENTKDTEQHDSKTVQLEVSKKKRELDVKDQLSDNKTPTKKIAMESKKIKISEQLFKKLSGENLDDPEINNVHSNSANEKKQEPSLPPLVPFKSNVHKKDDSDIQDNDLLEVLYVEPADSIGTQNDKMHAHVRDDPVEKIDINNKFKKIMMKTDETDLTLVQNKENNITMEKDNTIFISNNSSVQICNLEDIQNAVLTKELPLEHTTSSVQETDPLCLSDTPDTTTDFTKKSNDQNLNSKKNKLKNKINSTKDSLIPTDSEGSVRNVRETSRSVLKNNNAVARDIKNETLKKKTIICIDDELNNSVGKHKNDIKPQSALSKSNKNEKDNTSTEVINKTSQGQKKLVASKKTNDDSEDIPKKRKSSSESQENEPLKKSIRVINIDTMSKHPKIPRLILNEKSGLPELISEIKDEPVSSDDESSDTYLAAKRQYLSALNISEKTSEAVITKPHEVRTRARVGEIMNTNNHLNLIIDSVASLKDDQDPKKRVKAPARHRAKKTFPIPKIAANKVPVINKPAPMKILAYSVFNTASDASTVIYTSPATAPKPVEVPVVSSTPMILSTLLEQPPPTIQATVNCSSENHPIQNSLEYNLFNGITNEHVTKVISDVLCRPPPKLKPKPPGPFSDNFEECLPSTAGVMNSRINSMAHRLSDYFRGMLIETLSDIGKADNPAATIANLKLENESLVYKHQNEIMEIKKNINSLLQDLQKSIMDEKEKIKHETRAACEAETLKRIEDAKTKQWCANCLKEAQFYCCWNTSYCDYPCQIKHWQKHMPKCTQNAQTPQTPRNTIQPKVQQPIILRPTVPPKGLWGKPIVSKATKLIVSSGSKMPINSINIMRTSNASGHLTLVESTPGKYELVGNGAIDSRNAINKVINNPTILNSLISASQMAQNMPATTKHVIIPDTQNKSSEPGTGSSLMN